MNTMLEKCLCERGVQGPGKPGEPGNFRELKMDLKSHGKAWES